eukprot:62578-Ditylum_brightwellii.AAC.1
MKNFTSKVTGNESIKYHLKAAFKQAAMVVHIPRIIHEQNISDNDSAMQQQACSTSDIKESSSDIEHNCDVDDSAFSRGCI